MVGRCLPCLFVGVFKEDQFTVLWTKSKNPVYISDVGATNLQPLFISCAGFQAIFFVGSLIMDFCFGKKHKLQPFVLKDSLNLLLLVLFVRLLASWEILFVAIFNTNAFHRVHIPMVVLRLFFCLSFPISSIRLFLAIIPTGSVPITKKVIFSNHGWRLVHGFVFGLNVSSSYVLPFSHAFSALI